MAACSPATAVLSRNQIRLVSVISSKLPASGSLRCAPSQHRLPWGWRPWPSMVLQQRITPRAQAKRHTSSSFEELLKTSDKPVLVNFHATWSGPCQYMVPILEEVLEVFKDNIEYVEIDTDKDSRISDRYRVDSLPTFMIFMKGKIKERFVGTLAAFQLIQRVDCYVRPMLLNASHQMAETPSPDLQSET